MSLQYAQDMNHHFLVLKKWYTSNGHLWYYDKGVEGKRVVTMYLMIGRNNCDILQGRMIGWCTI